MAFKRNKGRQCKFETLENRRVLAGNVTAALSHGSIVIKGDNFDNSITVTSGGLNRITVTGNTVNGLMTSVNGTPNGSVTIPDVTKGMKIKMGLGNDVVTVNSVTINGKSYIKGGAGLDTITVNTSTFNSKFDVAGGAGADHITLMGTSVAGRSIVTGGANPDHVTLTSSNFGRLAVGLGLGDDNLSISNTSVTTETALNGGRGINTFDQGISDFFGGIYNKQKLDGGIR
jgi:hypothetical protein